MNRQLKRQRHLAARQRKAAKRRVKQKPVIAHKNRTRHLRKNSRQPEINIGALAIAQMLFGDRRNDR